jgi:hypothetical protein
MDNLPDLGVSPTPEMNKIGEVVHVLFGENRGK